ncbi:MAG: peptidase C11 [Clostridia bacterium]|nr:peptidase C11 [Clostridia bacterium]
MDNRPSGRQRNVTGQGSGAYRRGSGMGTGPVGRPGGYAGRQGSGGSGGPGGGYGGGNRSGGSGGGLKISPILIIIVIVLIAIFGGKGLFSGLLGGGSSYDGGDYSDYGVGSGGSILSGLQSSYSVPAQTTGAWTLRSNSGSLDSTVASAAREKYTQIYGGGRDRVTMMVYMCGADLESKSGMASADLAEMAKASLSDKVDIIVMTGGSKGWKTSGISKSVNQIYKIAQGSLKPLERDAGRTSMTDPDTLSKFIKYCAGNYPANRNMLIFWDHGGGSLSGFGYDERNVSSGSMSLSGIKKALSDGGVKFDFIGFDACLMATYENALMLSDFADYLIASEETEPGIGWYYTDWVSSLSKDPAKPTLEIGKAIADDFVSVCQTRCPGQKATLSVIDLSELVKTTPEAFSDFASATCELIKEGEYKTVSNARVGAREFSPSSSIDQIDAVHFAALLNTDEAKEFADSLLGAVKYNRVSSEMSNSYGLSIYFPYKRASKVNTAVKTYDDIGIDDEYSRCIASFAGVEATGTAASAGGSSSYQNLLGSFTPSSPVSSSGVTDIIGSLFGSSSSSFSDISSLLFSAGGLEQRDISDFVEAHQFDERYLEITSDGYDSVISMPESNWKLVNDLLLNVFYDDGEGFVDLGLDNVFSFNDKGDLIAEYDGAWVGIDGQIVPYYYESTSNDGDIISGRVPVLLNGDRAELIITFRGGSGYISGARYVYKNNETETAPKGLTELEPGDRIDYLCDYYSYSGVYQDSYMWGDAHTYTGREQVSDVTVDASRCSAMYLFRDIYNAEHFTPVLP